MIMATCFLTDLETSPPWDLSFESPSVVRPICVRRPGLLMTWCEGIPNRLQLAVDQFSHGNLHPLNSLPEIE
jgi:hypothetical protein